jgi:hypothetical protein
MHKPKDDPLPPICIDSLGRGQLSRFEEVTFLPMYRFDCQERWNAVFWGPSLFPKIVVDPVDPSEWTNRLFGYDTNEDHAHQKDTVTRIVLLC